MAVACSARASIPTCTRRSTHADRGSRCRHVPNATDDQRSERTSSSPSPSSPSSSSPSSSFRPATWREHRHGLVGAHLRSVLDVEAGGLREDHVPRAGPLGDALANALGAPGQHAVPVVDEEGLQVASAPVYVELTPRSRPERRRGRG